MSKIIDHISINDKFWIQFKDHLVSFGFKGLPECTHFTISFDDRIPDINFHVTKNAFDPNDKPHIKIVVIDKQHFQESFQYLILSLFQKVLEPFDINELKSKYEYELGFISFDKLQNNGSNALTEQHLIDCFKDISRLRRKSGLKIEGDIEERLQNLLTSEQIHDMLADIIVELPDEFEKDIEGGLLIMEDNTRYVMKIKESWFTINADLKPNDILYAFIDPQLARQILWKTKRALVAMKHATKYSDTESFNKPIRLESQPFLN